MQVELKNKDEKININEDEGTPFRPKKKTKRRT